MHSLPVAWHLYFRDDIQSIHSLQEILDAIGAIESEKSGDFETTGNAWTLTVNRRGAWVESNLAPGFWETPDEGFWDLEGFRNFVATYAAALLGGNDFRTDHYGNAKGEAMILMNARVKAGIEHAAQQMELMEIMMIHEDR